MPISPRGCCFFFFFFFLFLHLLFLSFAALEATSEEGTEAAGVTSQLTVARINPTEGAANCRCRCDCGIFSVCTETI